MQDTRELRQKRAALVTQANEILNKAETEKRSLTQEELNQYDAIVKDVDTQKETIDRMERQNKLEAESRENHQEEHKPDPKNPGGEERKLNPRETPEYRSVFARAAVHGIGMLSADEQRALSAGSDTAGGFITVPMQLATGLIKAVDDDVVIRRLATTYRLQQSQSLGAVSLDTDISDPEWTAEIKTGSEDSDMAFGRRELKPNPLAKRIKISNKLIRTAGIDVEALVQDRMRYKFSIVHENKFLNGNGVNQPLGLFTVSDQGITAAYDVSTGNTATEIKADGLIEAKFALKKQYWAKANWLFHRNALKMIRKMKTGEGDYLWRAGIATGQPDTILDTPYQLSEYVPSTFTTGLYVGMIGDFSFYWIADALDMTIQRLSELYAETGQIGFIARWESDGMPVLGEAFRRVKLA